MRMLALAVPFTACCITQAQNVSHNRALSPPAEVQMRIITAEKSVRSWSERDDAHVLLRNQSDKLLRVSIETSFIELKHPVVPRVTDSNGPKLDLPEWHRIRLKDLFLLSHDVLDLVLVPGLYQIHVSASGTPSETFLEPMMTVDLEPGTETSYELTVGPAKSYIYVPPPSSAEQSTANSTQATIERIRKAEHQSLPPVEARPASGKGSSRMTVINSTGSSLRVFFTGPVTYNLTMAAGESQTVPFPEGKYEMAAEVMGKNILPLYGQVQSAPGTAYSETFYIERHPD